MASSNNFYRRGTGRFEIRVSVPELSGPGTRSTYSRTSKLEIGLLSLGEILRRWANSRGAVRPGTTATLIDTTDGGPVAQLKWVGFEENTLDAALGALGAEGLATQEVPQPGKWLAGENQWR